MLFIDFENFDISKYSYYKKRYNDEKEKVTKQGNDATQVRFDNPKLDFNKLPQEIIKLLNQPHVLVKTMLFAPKPDDFLMKDERRKSVYNWINGMRNQDFFTVIEGAHLARPINGKAFSSMNIDDPSTYYVEEKGTDVNLAVNVISKAFHNAFDTAIILSGDTDYLPVMDTLNNLGKSVIVVGVKGQNLFKFKQHSDAQIILDNDFFQKCLR